MDVQTVTSPGGIEAWLVEDYAEPMFALRFAFQGGSAQDPVGKEGLANFLAMMLSQGAGHLKAIEFRQQIESLAVEVQFNPEFDVIGGSIEAMSESRSEVAQLVGMALARPRFDAAAIERVRRRLLSFHGGEARSPRMVADMQWNAAAFAGHPYARRGVGTEASVEAITAGDLKTYHQQVFARNKLKVAAVGDITAQELGELLDQMFGDLPEHADVVDIPLATPVTGGRLRVAEMELPQSVVAFGTGGVTYDSPDYMTVNLLSYILGGHGLASRLASELRQKRGLVFEAVTWLERRRHGVVLRGRLTTRNGKVAEALEVVREEMAKLAAGEITEADLDDAKSYLIRSYPVEYGSPGKIAARLLARAIDGFGAEFFGQRDEMIAAVSLKDLKRVAGQLLDPENLIVSIAGTPALQPTRAS